jgi:hypothetical protein
VALFHQGTKIAVSGEAECDDLVELVGPSFGLPADDFNGNVIIGNNIAGNLADQADTATPGPVGININSGDGGSPIYRTVISANVITREYVDVAINTPNEVHVHLNDLLGGKTGVAYVCAFDKGTACTGSVNATENYWGCPTGPRRDRVQHGKRLANHSHARIGQSDSGRSEIRPALNGKARLAGARKKLNHYCETGGGTPQQLKGVSTSPARLPAGLTLGQSDCSQTGFGLAKPLVRLPCEKRLIGEHSPAATSRSA